MVQVETNQGQYSHSALLGFYLVQSSFKLHHFVCPWRYIMYNQNELIGIHPS